MGGLSTSLYFLAVSLWVPTYVATPRIDNPLRFAFCPAFDLAVWIGVGFLCGMAKVLRTLTGPTIGQLKPRRLRIASPSPPEWTIR